MLERQMLGFERRVCKNSVRVAHFASREQIFLASVGLAAVEIIDTRFADYGENGKSVWGHFVCVLANNAHNVTVSECV